MTNEQLCCDPEDNCVATCKPCGAKFYFYRGRRGISKGFTGFITKHEDCFHPDRSGFTYEDFNYYEEKRLNDN